MKKHSVAVALQAIGTSMESGHDLQLLVDHTKALEAYVKRLRVMCDMQYRHVIAIKDIMTVVNFVHGRRVLDKKDQECVLALQSNSYTCDIDWHDVIASAAELTENPIVGTRAGQGLHQLCGTVDNGDRLKVLLERTFDPWGDDDEPEAAESSEVKA